MPSDLATADRFGLPLSWLDQFNGDDLDVKTKVSAIIGSCDEGGLSHISYLSAGEVLVESDLRVSLMLWPASHSAANISRSGEVVLHAAADGAIWEARLALRRRQAELADALAIFDGRIVAVRRHAAPYADVESLVGFRLRSPADTLERWRSQIARLRARPGGVTGEAP